MNLNISIDLSRVGLRGVEELLGPTKQVEMNEAMGLGIREKTTAYLQDIALTTHTTADRLGAEPSGYLEQAAAAVEKSPVTSDGAGGALTINHVGLIRAFRDVTILPVAAKALAIPLSALAYNRRPAQWAAGELFIWRSKTTGNAFLARRQEEKHAMPDLMYLLVRSVTQKQNRKLLPSDEEWATAAGDAARVWFDREKAETAASLS